MIRVDLILGVEYDLLIISFIYKYYYIPLFLLLLPLLVLLLLQL